MKPKNEERHLVAWYASWHARAGQRADEQDLHTDVNKVENGWSSGEKLEAFDGTRAEMSKEVDARRAKVESPLFQATVRKIGGEKLLQYHRDVLALLEDEVETWVPMNVGLET